MNLAPFLLDEWLERFKHGQIRHDLASSTGPEWTLQELLALASDAERDAILAAPLVYGTAAGSEALRTGIADLHRASPEDVIVTTGASEALHILFFAAAEPGANVVVSFPGFPPTATLPAALGLEVRTYRLRPENGFRLDPDEVKSLVDARTRLLLVTSPHNPTGAVIDEGELQALAHLAAAHGALFVADEVYHPLYRGEEAMTAAAREGALVVGDFSKALCLSGLRLGYLIDRNAERRARWLNARMHFTITSTSFGESLGALALRHRETIVGRARARVAANVAAFEQSVKSLQGLLGWVPLRGGTTAFPWLAFASDTQPFAEVLAAQGVLVVPGDCFGMPRHFRVGFGADPDFAAALRVLEQVTRDFAARAAMTGTSAAAARP
jgi:aspartate/methionine/tyrosine aminotransferase